MTAESLLAIPDGPRRSLAELEGVIERGLQTFVEVGAALREIRDRDLHRVAGFTDFDAYCQERWGFTRRRAGQLIEAADVTTEVGSMLPTSRAPENPRQASALAPLKEEPEAMAAAWREAVATAPAGKVTAAHVAAVVERYAPPVPLPAASAILGGVEPEAWGRAVRLGDHVERLAAKVGMGLRRLSVWEVLRDDYVTILDALITAEAALRRAERARLAAARSDAPYQPAPDAERPKQRRPWRGVKPVHPTHSPAGFGRVVAILEAEPERWWSPAELRVAADLAPRALGGYLRHLAAPYDGPPRIERDPSSRAARWRWRRPA